ncbi:hypothetical protein SARC_08599 [Sphaeroforma arctica JP610]|uniref:Zinc finger C2H2 LYAR-type domain-containing protein n=1 Tax=Sphaeroforma arctica JP610 TaxID=667725 RepID=A0A0L0FQK1_9EUKA|nr:hypothetical protein SARC_08599 [Sphaeroforma arctica JP610]KNC78984.1 hypothetical protein SARC_08599 [Sphaeroforma arctica JP610]|eukprot:XP_014152886.1 hypothetical protein SARC_08599 [Sphaeroforma arctica JP610]
MVFFQCDGCGEALKKAKVANHGCRAAVSCIDCNVVFEGNSYNQHSSCVSEAQRYQGALYKGASAKQLKKQNTQNQWLENIQQFVDSGDADRRMRPMLEKMLTYENIPRKWPKFKNFCSNSLGLRDESLSRQIFDDFVAKAVAAPSTAVAPVAETVTSHNEIAEVQVSAKDSDEDTTKKESSVVSKKSKKSKKYKKEKKSKNVKEVDVTETEAEPVKKSKKDKKSKKEKKESKVGSVLEETEQVTSETTKDKKAKKVKKAAKEMTKKRKRESGIEGTVAKKVKA